MWIKLSSAVQKLPLFYNANAAVYQGDYVQADGVD
jgi:hypothetical protein